jgi:hypothetical protein
MPNKDGTGPEGKGPGTGRGQGTCPPGKGFGPCGQGMRRGARNA